MLYYFQIKATGTCNYGIWLQGGSSVRIAGIDFAACVFGHIVCQGYSYIDATGNYTISGGSQFHWYADTGGMIIIANRTITISNTPAFTGSFAYATVIGGISCGGNTFVGSATGTHYGAVNGGGINTGGGGINYLPGDVGTGSATSPGWYA